MTGRAAEAADGVDTCDGCRFYESAFRTNIYLRWIDPGAPDSINDCKEAPPAWYVFIGKGLCPSEKEGGTHDPHE